MSVAIKMDELLVNWLSDDSMYENVMNLIEENKLAAQKQQQQQQQQQQLLQEVSAQNEANVNVNQSNPTTAGASSSRTKAKDSTGKIIANAQQGNSHNNKSSKNNGDNDDSNSNASPRCVIPKFYLSDPSRPRRRRRLLPVPQSDTWEPLPENEQQQDKINTAAGAGAGDEVSSGEINNVSSVHNSSTPSALLGGVVVGSGAPLCVRDQVLALFHEIGIPSQPAGEGESSNENDDNNHNHNNNRAEDPTRKYIAVHEFVRVTKEIFCFPTFFNVPLCRRLLYLWRLHQHHQQNMTDGKNDRNDDDDDDEAAAAAAALLATEEEPHPEQPITYEMVEWFWLHEMEPFDQHERFFRLLKQPTADYLVRSDFLPFIKALLHDHPGLEFLCNHAEFQEKYAVTVITRIFYCVNKSHSGRITCREIRRSDLLDAFLQVDEEEDINKITRFFSYEHFYVLYCRFWELDHDRDYRITREDLLKYGDHSLSHMIVDRIFDAAPRPFEQPSSEIIENAADGNETEERVSAAAMNREYLSYEDFIYFMLSEEDKANDVSVRYWFTCVDVDGDGKLNNMEMRSFYAVQLHRMQCMGHEIVPFEDMLCQMLDLIKPKLTDCIVVEDFLQPECAPVAGALFDALFNLNKYLQFEQRDPFVERQKREDEFETDWDRFACIDYNRLAMEEEAREEEAMEIDWVTVDDDEEDGLLGSSAAAGGEHGMQMQVQQPDEYMPGGTGYGAASSEAPF